MSTLLRQILGLIRRHPYLASGAMLLAILVAANYFLWKQRESATERHQLARNNGEKMLHALTDYSRITSDLAAVDGALQLIDRSLVVERDLEVNLGYFYQMETLSRVRLRQLNQLSARLPTDGNPFKVVPFSLQATGSYSQLINFLYNLETGPRLLRITSYSLNRSAAKTSPMMLDLTVESLGRP